MQHQAQGMAMQKAQLDLAEQEAKVKQAIANARKAEAEADQAEAEARMMPLTELDRAAALMGRMTPEQPQMEPMPGF
jgi:multidrug efflux pump subunit AcrA (membrane-fusion protein)